MFKSKKKKRAVPSLLAIVLLIIAWASNPDAESFKRYSVRMAGRKSDSLMERTATKLTAKLQMNLIDWEYANFGFFSVVFLPYGAPPVIGMFGGWWQVPKSVDKRVNAFADTIFEGPEE
jgi:hypothetical protein